MDLGTRPVEASPEEKMIKALRSRLRSAAAAEPRNTHVRRWPPSRGIGRGGAAPEVEMTKAAWDVFRAETAALRKRMDESRLAEGGERTWAERAADQERMEELLLAEELVRKWAALVAESEAYDARMQEIWLPAEGEDVEDYDCFAVEASRFREEWNERYSGYYGCFEDTTKIRNKRFTYQKPHENASTQPTLQVFSLKIAKLRAPLQWPLQVFGMFAIRDCVDHNRNIIFDRPRDNCQVVTQEDPYLKLTGPTRAVVALDPSTFEVDLKVKGTTESEDQWLSFLALTYHHFPRLHSHLTERDYASKLSELQFQLGSIIQSVEATIEVRIISGSWPHGLRAQFTAGTASITGAEVILLDSVDREVPVDGIGRCIELSRCVASVEDGGKLRVRVKAILDDEIVVNKVMHFKSQTSSVSNDSLKVDFDKEISKAKTAGKGNRPLGVDFLGCCTLGFNISWSVISFSEARC